MSQIRAAPTRSLKRREELRRSIPRPAFNLLAVFQRPEFVNAALLLCAFLVVVSGLVIWSREQVKVRDGQIMASTQVHRQPNIVENVDQTKAKQEEARRSSPRVYRLNQAYLGRLEASLKGLPKAVAGKSSVIEIASELTREFGLDEAGLLLLQPMAGATGEPLDSWTRSVESLINNQLPRNPLFESQEFQVFTTTQNKAVLDFNGDLASMPRDDKAIELSREPLAAPDAKIIRVVSDARFPSGLVQYLANKIQTDDEPTFVWDEPFSASLAKTAVAQVKPVRVTFQKGDVLYARGDTLKLEKYGEVLEESRRYNEVATNWQLWQPRLGAIALIALATLFIGSFATLAYPRMARNPWRFGAVCALMAAMLAITVIITVNAPMFLIPTAIGPTLFVAIILLLAYDQRFALLLSGMQAAFVTLALEQDAGFFLLMLCGCATAIVQLRELRHRNSLIRAASGTAAVLGVATIALGLLEIPQVPGAWKQILVMAFSSVLTSYGVSFLVLGILPSIEKLFDITTGMTLAELRDPKRPLLRQLQLKAAGTYNHSLQVANVAEAAAEAIEANGLLVYVGALYHDIGKINKPEYFVENQAGGYNKHEKLSPAMSLLVIIGHVKDGIELAREYSLPRSIIHFIESHHGTTLVEYFYHAAKSRAELTDEDQIEEVEFRYPGPKPRTKEAAILMISDAVESATRAMTEPNPGRIEGLVRRITRTRLDDGQFDHCDLSFRELRLIEDAIISRLCAIHHSRISYPSSAGTTGGNGHGQRSSDHSDLSKTTSMMKPATTST